MRIFSPSSFFPVWMKGCGVAQVPLFRIVDLSTICRQQIVPSLADGTLLRVAGPRIEDGARECELLYSAAIVNWAANAVSHG